MDREYLMIAGWVLLGLFLAPYLLMPLLIYFTLRFRCPAEVVQIDPATEPLSPEAREYFHHTYQQLTQLGYELVATLALPSLLPNVRSVLVLYINRDSGDMAMATFMLTTAGVSTLKAKYVEFNRKYGDGTEVQTNNSSELSSFRPRPGEHIYQFPDIQEVPTLHKLHEFLLEQHRGAGRPENRLDEEFQGDAVQFVGRAVVDDAFAAQQETGYLARTAAGYRPSVKGALLMTWQELWPIKSLRRAARDRRAKEILQEFQHTGRYGM